MESNSSDWSKLEIEQIVLWLEDPLKLRRTQKGSGETKKRWISSIASTIPSRSETQVGYKFNNLKKSYREDLKLAIQSGWGLGEEDLENGNTLSLQDKLEKKCPFFSQLDTIWGNRPNFHPPSLFSSGCSSQETAAATDALIKALETAQNSIEIDDDININGRIDSEDEVQSEIGDFWSSSVSYKSSSSNLGYTSSKPSPVATSQPTTSYSTINDLHEYPLGIIPPLSFPRKTAKWTSKKREFPILEKEDDEDRKRLKKKTTTSLGDAITVMAEKKYKFLEK